MSIDAHSNSEPKADDNGGNAAVVPADSSGTNTQQKNSHEYGANGQLVVDQTIASTDYASQQSSLVKGSTISLNVTPVDHNNGNSMVIVEDLLVRSYVVPITQ